MISFKSFSLTLVPTLLTIGFSGCDSGTLFAPKVVESEKVTLRMASTADSLSTGCLTPGNCANPNAVWNEKGTGALPNFRTALPFFQSAFGLAKNETGTLKKFEDRVYDNIPTYSNPGLMNDTGGISLIQLGAAACNDFLNKGRNQGNLVGNLNFDQSPSNNGGNWNNYRNILTSRLWGEASATGASATALENLQAKAIQQNSGDTRKVAYLLCISIASAPKALIN